MDWFRLHHGTPQDPKWIVVARRAGVPVGAVLSVWIAMLDAASRAGDRGTLEGWDHEDVAAMLGYETEEVGAIYAAMQGKTLDGDRILIQRGRNFLVADDRRLSPEWRETRLRIFERDAHTCVYCGEAGGPLECDHVIPYSQGGTEEDSNLVTACRACNRAKGGKTPEEWVQR